VRIGQRPLLQSSVSAPAPAAAAQPVLMFPVPYLLVLTNARIIRISMACILSWTPGSWWGP